MYAQECSYPIAYWKTATQRLVAVKYKHVDLQTKYFMEHDYYRLRMALNHPRLLSAGVQLAISSSISNEEAVLKNLGQIEHTLDSMYDRLKDQARDKLQPPDDVKALLNIAQINADYSIEEDVYSLSHRGGYVLRLKQFIRVDVDSPFSEWRHAVQMMLFDKEYATSFSREEQWMEYDQRFK